MAETALSCQLGGNIDFFIDVCVHTIIHLYSTGSAIAHSRMHIFYDILHDVIAKVGTV